MPKGWQDVIAVHQKLGGAMQKMLATVMQADSQEFGAGPRLDDEYTLEDLF